MTIKPIHKIFPKIEAVSKRKRNRVGIGILRDSEEVRKSLKKGSEHADIIVVSKHKIKGFETVALGEVSETEYSKALIKLLEDGKVDAIVRGQVKYGEFEKTFKAKFGFVSDIGMLALMQDIFGRQWFYTSADPFDKSEVPEHKIDLIEKSVRYMELYGIKAKIGVLAGDFTFDRGESAWIDQTIHNGEYIVKVLSDEGYDIKNYAHLINEAVDNSNLIVFINGSQGNFVYRSLYQFGGALEMGAFVFVPTPYIESSRYHFKYDAHIIEANAEVNLLRTGVNKVYDPKSDPKKKWSKHRVII
ncbi:MAG: methanogen marker protein 4 [Microgenomates group bacterium Gr01-1014_7]|nr:MAG: methanogen marker protein 4 [Microgenomates group bacterium Gr01-1014_7]